MTALDDIIALRATEISVMKQANTAFYTQHLAEVAILLHGTEEQVQDALIQTCIEHSRVPGEVLQLVHDFLVNWQECQQEDEDEEEQAEPEPVFFGREEQGE